jgi:hypothetical protein
MTEFIFGRNDHCKTVTDARARQIAAQELAEIKRAADAEVKAVMRRISALLVAGFAIFGEGRTTRGARLRRKSMSMM